MIFIKVSVYQTIVTKGTSNYPDLRVAKHGSCFIPIAQQVSEGSGHSMLNYIRSTKLKYMHGIG